MRSILFLLLVLFVYTDSYSQVEIKTVLPAWTFNTQDTRIYGVSVGFISKKIDNVVTNGIRFEPLGLGILLPLIPSSPISQTDSAHERLMSESFNERINGINLAPLGVGCNCRVNGINIYAAGSIVRVTNGISLGGIMNFAEVQNGIQASMIGNFTYHSRGIQLAAVSNDNTGTATGIQVSASNKTAKLHGLQIGLFNKTQKIKGLQIGLWNVNDKRRWPLINF